MSTNFGDIFGLNVAPLSKSERKAKQEEKIFIATVAQLPSSLDFHLNGRKKNKKRGWPKVNGCLACHIDPKTNKLVLCKQAKGKIRVDEYLQNPIL